MTIQNKQALEEKDRARRTVRLGEMRDIATNRQKARAFLMRTAMQPLLLKLLFTLMPKRAPALLRPLVRKVSNQALTALVNPQIKQHMDYWEGELGKSEWFAGSEFTAADIQMSFPLEAAQARGGLEQGHPKAMAFLERIHARPAYNRALEKGGPYQVGR